MTTSPAHKEALAALAVRYQAALRIHLGGKTSSDQYDGAKELGRLALVNGLAARDLVLVHEHALTTLLVSAAFNGAVKRSLTRAGRFLAHALAPLEVAQRSTREAIRHLRESNETLSLHTAALARGNRRLEREVARRQAGETAIRSGQEKYRTLFLESLAMQKKLRQLTRQVLSAQEEERKRISRELHDEVVQTLVGINVELAALSKCATSGLRIFKSKIARTQKLVENSVNAVHRFARELRPTVLDDLGLIPALHAFSQNLVARKKLKIQLTAFHGVEALSATKRTVLFRVAQEALTNVARHARATHATLCIVSIPDGIRMEIADNGKSFPVEQTRLARNPRRLGLVGMKERIEMIGGTLEIISLPGKGTTVRAELPFADEQKSKQ